MLFENWSKKGLKKLCFDDRPVSLIVKTKLFKLRGGGRRGEGKGRNISKKGLHVGVNVMITNGFAFLF